MSRPVVFTSRITALMLLAVVGFGIFQGSRLLDQGTGPYSSEPYVLLGISVGGICCIILAILSFKANFNELKPIFLAGVVMLAIRIGASLVPEPSEALLLFAQLAAGIGWMLILVCWMHVFVSYRPVYSLPMIWAVCLIDYAVLPVANALFPDGRYEAFVVTLVFSIVALGICLKQNHFIAGAMLDDAPAEVSLSKLMARISLILIAIFTIAATFGFVMQRDIVEGLVYVQTDLTAILGLVIALMLFILFVVFRPRKRTVDIAYPVVVVCLVLVLICRAFGADEQQFFGSLMSALLLTFFALFWMTFVRDAFERRLPSLFLLGLAVGVAQLSMAGGRLAAIAMQGLLDMQNFTTVALCAVSFIAVVALSVVVAVVFWRAQKEKIRLSNVSETSESLSTPCDCVVAENHDTIHDSAAIINHAALELLRSSFHLSKREFQIISEYSTGRSARYIAETLMLSEYTIKSHLRRAYAKMDVHSRQELLCLIDQMEARVRTQAQDR